MPLDQNFNYYSVHDFHSSFDIKCSAKDKSFSALNCNIRSLAANHDNLMHMLSELDFSFSVIGLSETKLKADQECFTDINIPGYDFISEPSLSNAGGVAFYIRDYLTYSILAELSTSNKDFEALWIEINFIGQPNLICGIVYRHPNANLENVLNYIDSTIEKIHQQNKLSLLMGDFNLDLLKIGTHPASDNFLNSLGSFCFQPQILQPTRITDHSSTLIDNIFFNSIEHFTISGNLVYDLTDHLPNFIIFNKFSLISPKTKIHKRDFSNLDKSALINEYKLIDWHTVFSPDDDPSNMFDHFYSKISEITDKHIPIKQLSRKELKFVKALDNPGNKGIYIC